jgi:nucleoid-associated protein YgaU
MTDTAAPPSRAEAWVQTHKPAAAGGAGVALVLVYALYRRSHPSSAAAADPNAAPAGGAVAGLSGLPDTSGTDIQNAVQGQLNDALAAINDQLNAPKPPTPPAVPAPTIPANGKVLYKIKTGDTIGKICTAVYGVNDTHTHNLIKMGNPVLAAFPWNAPLTFFVGQTIRIPAYIRSQDHTVPPPQHPPVKGRPPVPKPPKIKQPKR